MSALITLLLVACVQSGLGNPTGPVDSMKLLPSAIAALALLCETLIVAALLTRWKFNFVRTLVAWFIITFGTYCFLWGGRIVLERFAYELYEGFNIDIVGIQGILSVVIFEVLVMLIEAYIIMRLAASPFFRAPTGLITWKDALVVSIAGNLVSFVAGQILSRIIPSWPVIAGS